MTLMSQQRPRGLVEVPMPGSYRPISPRKGENLQGSHPTFPGHFGGVWRRHYVFNRPFLRIRSNGRGMRASSLLRNR